MLKNELSHGSFTERAGCAVAARPALLLQKLTVDQGNKLALHRPGQLLPARRLQEEGEALHELHGFLEPGANADIFALNAKRIEVGIVIDKNDESRVDRERVQGDVDDALQGSRK